MDREPHGASNAEAVALSEALHLHREEILVRWADLYRQNRTAGSLTEEQLLDFLPRLLDKLIASVSKAVNGEPALSTAKESTVHALHRLEEGFDLPEITLGVRPLAARALLTR